VVLVTCGLRRLRCRQPFRDVSGVRRSFRSVVLDFSRIGFGLLLHILDKGKSGLSPLTQSYGPVGHKPLVAGLPKG
jgi:hypothetical protein